MDAATPPDALLPTDVATLQAMVRELLARNRQLEARIAPLPPPYFWNFGNRRPDGVNYLPTRDAIDCVIEFLRLQGREYP